MKSQNQNFRELARPIAMTAAGALIIVVAVFIASRSPKQEPAPVAAAPEVSTPAVAPVARTKPAAPVEEESVRPEIALLQELPKAHVTRTPDSPLSDLKVSFKLDSRFTKSLYMGDRWLSPATHLQVGAGETCTVEASIRGVNAKGKAVNTPATWWVADTEMVKVSPPGPGNTVKLTVTRPGKTTVEVASQGITKYFPLHARSYGGTIMVAMAQE